MCLANQVVCDKPKATGIGYKVMRCSSKGNLRSPVNQSTTIRPLNKWLKAQGLSKETLKVSSGWYIFNSRIEAVRYLGYFFINRGEYVITKVEWRGLLAKGETTTSTLRPRRKNSIRAREMKIIKIEKYSFSLSTV